MKWRAGAGVAGVAAAGDGTGRAALELACDEAGCCWAGAAGVAWGAAADCGVAVLHGVSRARVPAFKR